MDLVYNYDFVAHALKVEPDEAVAEQVRGEVADVLAKPYNPPLEFVSYRMRGKGGGTPDPTVVELSHDYVLAYTVSQSIPANDTVIRIRGFGKSPLV